MEKENVIKRLNDIIIETVDLAPENILLNIRSAISILQEIGYTPTNAHIIELKNIKRSFESIENKKKIGIKFDTKSPENFKNQFLAEIREIIKGVESIGLPKPKIDKMSAVINNNNNMSQSQKQTQEIAITIFLESIKDELTGRQIKEIKEIMDQEDDINQAKPKIIEKLKSFGGDVLSNVIANIITNPTIWASF